MPHLSCTAPLLIVNDPVWAAFALNRSQSSDGGNMDTKHSRVVILGSGPAGLTAAIYAARAGLSPLLIHGNLPGGQLTTTTEVENFPGFPDGIMGPDLMKLFEKQAERFGTKFVADMVEKVELNARPFLVSCSGTSYSGDSLIIATGARPRLLGVPGESELMGYGVSTCATCDGAFFRNQIIAVLGGGDSACEEALFLSRFGSKVYLIHRRDELRASKIMQKRVLKHDKIEMVWSHTLKEIHGDKKSGVQCLTLVHRETGKERVLECSGVFIAIGHIPSSQLFTDHLEVDVEGYIVTRPHSTATNVPGVFACGDVQDHIYRQAITAAGSGCMAAIEAERWLELHE
jgi:thioredoxin reductase (NADPH)